MSAREKLENLTLLWIGHSVVSSGLMFFLRGGFGFWNVVVSSVSLLVGVGITVLIGRALLNGNGLVRGLVVLLAGIGTAIAAVGIGKLFLLFVSTWSLGLFWPFVALGTVIAMNLHSLRVLFSRPVRRHFR